MVDIVLPSQLHADVAGFEALGRVAARLDGLADETVCLRGLRTWCDGQLCAALGALLHGAAQNFNSFQFGEEVSGQVLNVWGKNGFWRHFGGMDVPDTFDTTLAFDRFDADDEKRFAVYIQRELMPKELPNLSDRASGRFRRSVQELFNNAASHGQTPQGVFSCGQTYPTRDRLMFCVADLGVGFRANVTSYLGNDFTSVEAIEWALVEGNTTRQGSTPGGLGLTWLWEFAHLNGGELQIVSHEGIWEWRDGTMTTNTLRNPFPGTVVTLGINTWDDGDYGALDEDEDEEPLF